MAVYVVKTLYTVFVVGLLVMAILSFIGLAFLTQLSYSDDVNADGKNCGGLSNTQRDITRMTVVVMWVMIVWIILGAFIQRIWKKGGYEFTK